MKEAIVFLIWILFKGYTRNFYFFYFWLKTCSKVKIKMFFGWLFGYIAKVKERNKCHVTFMLYVKS